MAKVKRSEIWTYIDTVPSTEVYDLLGEGVVSGAISYNPKTTEETYIHQDNAAITVDSYAPTMAVEATAIYGDDVFDFVDGLRKSRAVLSAAETTIVNVWVYEGGGPTAYPAEQQAVSIQVDEYGGEGGQAAKISFTINFIGDPVPGTFNSSTAAFTPT